MDETKKTEVEPQNTEEALNPFVIFKDVYEYMLKTYPTMKVSDVELVMAWLFTEVNTNIRDVAPESETTPTFDSADKLLYISQKQNNTLLRLCNNIVFLDEAIKKAKKESEKKCECKGECDCKKE